jgi:hypothetical protein
VHLPRLDLDWHPIYPSSAPTLAAGGYQRAKRDSSAQNCEGFSIRVEHGCRATVDPPKPDDGCPVRELMQGACSQTSIRPNDRSDSTVP